MACVGGIATNRYNKLANGDLVDTAHLQELQRRDTRITSMVLVVSLLLLACLALEAWLLYAAADTAAAILGVVALVGISVAIHQLCRLRA